MNPNPNITARSIAGCEVVFSYINVQEQKLSLLLLLTVIRNVRSALDKITAVTGVVIWIAIHLLALISRLQPSAIAFLVLVCVLECFGQAREPSLFGFADQFFDSWIIAQNTPRLEFELSFLEFKYVKGRNLI